MTMRLATSIVLLGAVTLTQPLPAQQAPPGPDVAAQREAMKKLDFMPGKWSGEILVFRGPGEPKKIQQSEDIQYKLDGLVLQLEGTGRDDEGKVVFRALATVAYDDRTRAYRFRSYNDGRYIDTEFKVGDKGWEWGIDAGPAKIRYAMRVNEKGEWKETGEMTMGDGPPRKIIEMTARRQP